DSTWPIVAIPHTWSTFEITGELHPFIHDASEKNDTYWWYGWGWYRKHFILKKEYADKKVFLEFEGVQKYCKVWINGHYLGDHKGGYGSFDFDLTSYIKPGEDNVLAVAVNNRQNDSYRIPPMAAGNFDVYGGIYRDVTLVLKDKLYIPMQGSASHEGGTFITTPSVNENQGMVRVQTWVMNDYDQSKNCALKTTILDAQDKVVQVLQSKQQIKPGELFRFDQMSKPVMKPHLWSHDSPYLYKVKSEVIDNGQTTDEYESPLGFRWFWWDYKDNFLYMNGKKVVIHGGNRHQEYPWLGDAIPKWITRMDYQDIVENLNYNFMRTVHYPNDKLVYELTDKYGIAIDEETPSIKNQVFSTEVQEQQMKEMIRRDRNHPSIVIWSMGNETNHATDSKYAVAEDTTRIITARRVLEGSAGAFAPHSDENLGIESLLRCTIRGWYNKDVKDLEPKDGQHCGTEEHQQNMLIASGRLGTGNLCTWIYADHGCDRQYLNCPLKYINPKGYVDAYRVPKYAYYLWQATYAKEPMAFILPHFWRSQYLGQMKDITVDSNCDTVELKVNGISKGIQFPSDANFHCVTFKNILVEKGTLSVVGKKKGRSVTTQVIMAGEPARIVLRSSHQKINAERSSIAIIKADIVDAQGTHVYGATNTVRWSVSGPATLVGPQVYESDIDKNDQTDGMMYTDMPVANLIRSNGKPGRI
ncbi:MAG TPA: glycoside hydrolase family 2 TIM barrel-domain containing protein, partial [Bacteroidales bacterium]